MAVFKSSPQPLQPGQRLADDDTLNLFLGNPSKSMASGLVATGANAAGALPLAAAINQFATVAANTGAMLAVIVPGGQQDIYNDGANPLTVYAPAGATIDGGAAGGSVPLANAKRCSYICMSPGVYESAQLGAVSA